MLRSLVVALFGLISVVYCQQSAVNSTYTIVAPARVRPNAEYHVSVSVHDVQEHVDVDITLSGPDQSGTFNTVTKTVVVNPDETRILSLTIGEWGPGNYKLICEGRGGLTFKNDAQVEFEQKSYSVFIQTDKAIYKPGQLVQFRAIIVDPSLAPSLIGAIDIHITDAKNNRVKQWNRTFTSKGIVAKDLQLSDQPILGDWTIHVSVLGQQFKKSFTVAEYVLPTFDVEVGLPSYATYLNSDVVATIKSTYTYGKPAKGEVTLTVQPRVRYSHLSVRPLEQFQAKVQTNGSVDIPVNVVRDLNLKTDFFQREIEFFALVEEGLTGRKYNKTGILKMFDKDVKVELIKTSKTFKPGLNYTFYLKVAFQDDIPVDDNGPPLKLRYGYSYNEEQYNNTLELVPEKGMIKIEIIPPNLESVYVLGMKADYKGQTFYLESIEAAQSPSRNFIQVTMPSNQKPQVGKDMQLEVKATEKIAHLVYQVMGRGDILLSRSEAVTDNMGHTFTIPVTQRMAPKARVVVYYVRPQSQEVVADALNFDVEGVFRTPCDVSTNINQTKPGANVDVIVSTTPGAYVGVLGLDQSILLLKTGNDVTQDDVIEELETYNGGRKRSYPHWRGKRSLWWPGSASAGEIFDDSGIIVLTNGLVHRNFQQIYYRMAPMPMAVPAAAAGPSAYAGRSGNRVFNSPKSADGNKISAEPNKVTVRKYFPETWLWSLNTTGNDGYAIFPSKIPDTITSWVVSAFSMDQITGLGIASKPAKVTVFRPFFIKLSLPYSIIRGESIAIQVIVFNYFQKDLNAEVTLENVKKEFEFTVASNEINALKSDETTRRKFVSIPAQDGAAVTFLITPKKLGPIDIKVTAVTDKAGDSVLKKLLVKPEGQPQYFNKVFLVDFRERSGTLKKNMTIEVPSNAVPESEVISVSAIGDILGPSISNLDNLLLMPYGCGEQNMINFVPNIVVLDYLTRANRLTSATKDKAVKNMESGYQRELTYKRDDGSFSAFGASDKSGSTWLTSYVLKSFQQAKPYIDIDPAVIEKSVKWLISQQTSSGSFGEPGEVHHKGMQGSSGSAGAALSAYVMIALLQDRNTLRAQFSSEMNLGEQYLAKELRASNNVYQTAMITYALHLLESPARDAAYSKLIGLAQRNSDHMWWANELDKKANLTDKQSFHYFLPNSNEVETTSYALLTAMLRSDMETAIPAMRWLISKQNANGGFSSTQDTVIGLQALGQLATRLSTTTIAIDAKFKYGVSLEKMQALQMNRDNALVMNKRFLPSETRNVEIEASGFGTAIIQVSWQYNLKVSSEETPFYLNPLIGKTSTENFIQLNICTYYKAGNETNMAVMEVELPSGFVADVDALPSLTRAKEIKRIDTSEGDTRVIIYFDRITRDELCLTVPGHRLYKVANHKSVPVTLYDYYNRLETSRNFYSPSEARICDICEESDCDPSCLSSSQTGDLSVAGSSSRALYSNAFYIVSQLALFNLAAYMLT